MDSHRLENVSAAISFIETHLDETLSLDTIARAAGYSKFHLHRVYANGGDHAARLYPAQAADGGGEAIGLFRKTGSGDSADGRL